MLYVIKPTFHSGKMVYTINLQRLNLVCCSVGCRCPARPVGGGSAAVVRLITRIRDKHSGTPASRSFRLRSLTKSKGKEITGELICTNLQHLTGF